MAALEQAYKNTIMVGRFPACVLNIELNPAEDAERFVREAEENERNPQKRKLLFSFEDIDRMMERSRKYLKEHGGKTGAGKTGAGKTGSGEA